jgi:hypothetical protein
MRPRVGGCKAGNHDNDLELTSIGRGFGFRLDEFTSLDL